MIYDCRYLWRKFMIFSIYKKKIAAAFGLEMTNRGGSPSGLFEKTKPMLKWAILYNISNRKDL